MSAADIARSLPAPAQFPAERFDGINAPLFAAAEATRPLILVHRGSGRGTIAENTAKSTRAALTEGADIIELDVVESTDGDYFCFHDGYEPMHFGIDRRLWQMSSAEIRALNYSWALEAPGAAPVAALGDILEQFPGTFFNIDRSWRWWPGLLDVMAEHADPSYLVLKSPVEDAALEALAAHPVKYPYMPIVRSLADVERVLAPHLWERVNTVGLELLAREDDHPFVDDSVLSELRGRGLLLLANAINLSNGVPLYDGFDDETSMLDDPARGWGVLVDKGHDVIQTDWPASLASYLTARGLRG